MLSNEVIISAITAALVIGNTVLQKVHNSGVKSRLDTVETANNITKIDTKERLTEIHGLVNGNLAEAQNSARLALKEVQTLKEQIVLLDAKVAALTAEVAGLKGVPPVAPVAAA